MTNDVSKKTLVVLVFLVILVTIFGTWAVLQSSPQKVIQYRDQASGIVMLEIAGEDPTSSNAEPVQSTGNVVLEIIR